MADTLAITAQIQETSTISGTLVRKFGKSITPVGNLLDSRRISVGTSEETHTISAEITGGANKPGWAFVLNQDATNHVQVGVTATVYFARLAAGWGMLVPLDNALTAIFLKANTAACQVEISIWER